MIGFVNKYKKPIIEFIHRVFDYYNGKINIFNDKAKLYIDFAQRWDSGVGGISRNPNIVFIYPYVIERFTDNEYYFWYNIIVTVIHELFHIDQDINYIRTAVDLDYKNYIEDAVEVQTYLYMANNQKEIAERFGIEDQLRPNQYMPMLEENFNTGCYYKRKDYLSHMVSMLRDLMYEAYDNPTINKFIEIFNDLDSKIYIHINNIEFVLKDGIYCMGINQLNEIMEDEFFQFNMRYAYVEINDRNDNIYVVTISTQCNNLMYHIIKEN